MKKSLLLILTTYILLFATACSQNIRIVADKNYIIKEVKTDNFNGISIPGSIDVVYTQGEAHKVEIYGSQNIVDLVQASVVNGILEVKFKNNVWIQNNGTLEARVSNPEINSLTLNGSGDIYFKNGINTQKDFSISISGSGDVNGKSINCKNLSISINGSGDIGIGKIESQKCEANIFGSGDICLSGNTQTAEYQIDGSGDVDAGNLKAVNVKAISNGSGDIRCYTTGKLIGRSNGSGDISYKGTPQEIDYPKK